MSESTYLITVCLFMGENRFYWCYFESYLTGRNKRTMNTPLCPNLPFLGLCLSPRAIRLQINANTPEYHYVFVAY